MSPVSAECRLVNQVFCVPCGMVGGGRGWLGVTHAGTKKLVSFCLTAISHSLQFSQLSVSTTFNTWEGLGKYIIPRLIYAQLAVLYFSQMG